MSWWYQTETIRLTKWWFPLSQLWFFQGDPLALGPQKSSGSIDPAGWFACLFFSLKHIFNNQRNWGNGISLFLKIGKLGKQHPQTNIFKKIREKSATVIHQFLTLPDGIFRGRINEVPSVPPAEWILIVKKSKGPIRNSAETLQPIETHQLNQLFIGVWINTY